MSKSARLPENTIEAQLASLYARRSAVDDLIRSLELYHQVISQPTGRKGPGRQTLSDAPAWAKSLAS